MVKNNDEKQLRLAMIGMRGLPADLPKAGGGERETEAKATRLAARVSAMGLCRAAAG